MGLVGALVPAIESVSDSVRIPRTLHKSLSFSGIENSTITRRLPFEATDLGVKWRGSGSALEVRTSPEGTKWGRWQEVTESPDLLDETTQTHYSALIAGSGARWAQIRATEATTSDVALEVMNTRDGPKKTFRQPRSAQASTGQPQILPRAAWGADESIRRKSPDFARVRKIFVHHTATANNDADPAGTIRAIYNYHVKVRGWDDIGYNFLIDPKGNIFEGRYSGSPTPEGPTGEDANGSGVVGSHVSKHNAGSVGVALLADSNAAVPTARAIDSLVEFLAWKADRQGINPTASDSFPDGTGGSEKFPNIAAHQDSPDSATNCPGVHLNRRMRQLRQLTEGRINEQSGLLPLAMPAGTQISPAGPTLETTPNLVGNVGRRAARVEVTFSGSALRSSRKISVAPSNGVYTVDDGDYGSRGLSPGTYSIRAVAFDAAGGPSAPAPVADVYTIEAPPLIPLIPLLPLPGTPLGPGAEGLFSTLEQLLRGLSL